MEIPEEPLREDLDVAETEFWTSGKASCAKSDASAKSTIPTYLGAFHEKREKPGPKGNFSTHRFKTDETRQKKNPKAKD
jgi:hypothetical protein